MADRSCMKLVSDRESYWRGHLTAQVRSGLSASAYCRFRGLSAPSFYYWKRKLAPESGQGQGGMGREKAGLPGTDGGGGPIFAEVRVAGLFAEAPALEVVLANGLRVVVRPGFDGETLARVVQALEGGAC